MVNLAIKDGLVLVTILVDASKYLPGLENDLKTTNRSQTEVDGLLKQWALNDAGNQISAALKHGRVDPVAIRAKLEADLAEIEDARPEIDPSFKVTVSEAEPSVEEAKPV